MPVKNIVIKEWKLRPRNMIFKNMYTGNNFKRLRMSHWEKYWPYPYSWAHGYFIRSRMCFGLWSNQK